MPPGKARMVMYTPGSSSSTHSLSSSLPLLTEADRSTFSGDELVLTDASTDEVSVFAPLMLDNLGVDDSPTES